jgi:FAD binding domain/Berberine and berberine like
MIRKTTKRSIQWGLPAAEELCRVMPGKVVKPGDVAYAGACRIWNGAVNHQPALIALCETAGDVQAALRVARTHRLPLSVRGGGHDWAGRALRHNRLVIDLTKMRQVEVDAKDQAARVAGGATANDLIAATAPHGLAAVTGNVGAVGMAGFTLGGGYGPLTTRFGLGLDNLLETEVVLADGRLVFASPSQNSDLFWALRGGGGNFGVVTSMRLRLHPVGELLAGVIMFPWSEAPSVLRGHAEILSSAPGELSVLAGVFSASDGSPVMVIGPIWSGEPNQGQEIIARMQSFGTPILSQIGPMSYTDLIRLYDSEAREGCHYAVKTRWLDDLTPEIISAVVAAGTTRTSPASVIAFHHFHGPGTEIAPDATAFGLRRKHFLMEIIAAWEPNQKEDGSVHRRWASDLFSVLDPHALPGGYPNFLTQDDCEQLGSAYGINTARLRDLKRRYDPDEVFTSAIPLPFMESSDVLSTGPTADPWPK